MPAFHEFFSGGGMARLGLGERWECTFSNDFCPKKAKAYRANFGGEELHQDDIKNITVSDLPGRPALSWASFPCQDLSLAGNGAGLNGERSGTFNRFIHLLAGLKTEKRHPGIVVLENVVGTLHSNQGKDFELIVDALRQLGYRVGCMLIDGVHFVPQSRPRVFFVATLLPKSKMGGLVRTEPHDIWHPDKIRTAYQQLSEKNKRAWLWWDLPVPEPRKQKLMDIVEREGAGFEVNPREKTDYLISMMSDRNLKKLNEAKSTGQLVAGGLYRRVRRQPDGTKLQRSEVRFDGIAGCLRTPSGGSSRQTVLLVDGDEVKSRLLTTREVARLMGVPEEYKVPDSYNEAYHLFGDGLVVPAVSWLERGLLTPLNQRM
jgi:DNA (cytosine-5)-methyltransferase 1